MNTAIIVAAGSGSRFAATQTKQFARILGKPLIIHTLEKFEACPAVDQIVLVLSIDGCGEYARLSGHHDIKKLKTIVTGGKTRAESVRNGLARIDPATANVVAVHDGARPLVSVDEITRTIKKALQTGAACLSAEITDTVKEVSNGNILRTVNRTSLRRALTPQAFHFAILKEAFEGVDLTEEITDECNLVERLDNYKIALVEGSSRNIKVTHPEDIQIAEMFLRHDE